MKNDTAIRKGRTRRWAGGAALWILRAVLAVALLLAALLAYLHAVGVPRALLDDALDRLAKEGWFVKTDRVRLTIDRGVVATGVEVYETAESPAPFATADSVSAALSPALLLRHGAVAPTLELEGGALEATFGGTGGTVPRRVRADGIRVRFSARQGELVFRDAEATCLGVRMRGHGALYTGENEEEESMGNPLPAVLAALAELPEEALQAIDALQTMRFGGGAEARFSFTVYPEHPEANAAAVRFEAPGGATVMGIEADAFRAEAAWRDGKLEPARATVEIGGNRLAVEGSWDSAANVASVRVENGIPAAAVLPALPDGLRRMLEESVEPLDFPLRTEAQLGPASPEHLADTAEVRVEAGPLRAWGMALAGVSAEVRREGSAWRVPKATLTLDKEGERCALVATGMAYDAEKGTFSGRVKGKVRPDALLDCTALGEDSFVRDILERFGFAQAGDVDFRVRGRTEPFGFVALGNASVEGASLHGVTVDTAETLLAVTTTNLTATGAKMTRPEGWARGEVSVDFDACTVRLDVDTTFAPRAVCQLLGPTVEEFAAPFKMEGPCHSSLKGTLDYHNFARTRLEGHAEGEQLGYGPWVAETASADVRVNGYRVDVSNATGRLWGGDVKGEASFFPVRTADTWHFEGAAEGTKVSLADALAATFEKPSENMHGAVSFSGNVGGDFGDGLLESLNGDMRVSVADGLLFQTRLLSGLSSMLQLVIPGFDWFAQTDASATVSIRNGVARTEDANIAGPLFGVKAKGACDAAGRTLNFQVEVKLLDRGILATLVHIATAPVTRLLKFRLSGTLDDPHWSAVNLNPKKLLKIVKPSTYTGSDEEKNSGPAKPLPVPTAE